ncbi:MAG: hypothetical protein RMK89_10775 [Armatimonadota bacterium]|nr:hypothetical protein [Armatimonadota bacterium]MDW8143932.1 hypothetical protein [Armatimonadota bacterium]
MESKTIDVSRSLWAWREACGRWLFQNITLREDFPIDPNLTPSSLTRLTISQPVAVGSPLRVFIPVVFTWGKGEFQTPKITSAGLGEWVFENGFAVIVDEKGLKVKTGGTEVRLNLPQDMPIPKRICDGQFVVPDLPSKKLKALGFREISAKGLIVGKPTALRQIGDMFVMATDRKEVLALDLNGQIRWKRKVNSFVRSEFFCAMHCSVEERQRFAHTYRRWEWVRHCVDIRRCHTLENKNALQRDSSHHQLDLWSVYGSCH